jgi:hypothetical protein
MLNKLPFHITTLPKALTTRYMSFTEMLTVLKETKFKEWFKLDITNHDSLYGGIYGITHALITVAATLIPYFLLYWIAPILGILLGIVGYCYYINHWTKREISRYSGTFIRPKRCSSLDCPQYDKKKTLDSILDLVMPFLFGTAALLYIVT